MEKVYGIRDNKCRVEIMTKNQSFGITKVYMDKESNKSVYMSFPKNGDRYIFANTIEALHINNMLDDIPDNYYSEIIVRVKNRVSKPTDFLNISTVKYLNKNLDVSKFDVLHYHFTYDGIHLCCYCAGYTDESIVI